MRVFLACVGACIALLTGGASESLAFTFIQNSANGKQIKWGEAAVGTPATVTYAFVPTGARSTFETDKAFTSLAELSAASGFAPAAFETQLRRAFAAWSRTTPVAFTEIRDAAKADVRVGALRIDGPKRRVAHAHLEIRSRRGEADRISRCEIHFDTSEAWAPSFDHPNRFNLYYVALHEIGHVLGLDDLPQSRDAVMHPKYQRRFVELQPDDIAGASALYGEAPAYAAHSSQPAGAPLSMTATPVED
jgi:Matrixin